MEEQKKLLETLKNKVVENKKTVTWIGVGLLAISATVVVAYLGLNGHGYSDMQPLADAVGEAVEAAAE